MKKNRLTLFLAIILISIAAYFLLRNNFSTVRQEDRDFAIEDTAAVTRIFIADRNNHTVTLDRKGTGVWQLNGKYEPRMGGVTFILDCLKKIRVQSRVPKNSFNTVVRELSSTGLKMEIYLNGSDKPAKTYFIGGSTQDVLGTYMMLSNSTVPFVTEVPGFNGYLTPRFSPIERDWLIPEMLDIPPSNIKSVTMEYMVRPENSFTIERSANGYHVYSPSGNREVRKTDNLRITNYLEGFTKLNFEAWDYHLDDRQKDSLKSVQPVSVLTVVDTKGTKTIVPMYLKPVTASSLAQIDSAGNPLTYDTDRLYAFINHGKELVTIQYFVFNKIFASLNDFDLEAPRRKLRQ
jgi:hypothetical protein